MINELQRQAYLSALGIDNYMPRVILPFAPASVVCELPVFTEVDNLPPVDQSIPAVVDKPVQVAKGTETTSAIEMLGEVSTAKRSGPLVNAATILEQLDTKKAPAIAPFALSLWRPVPGFLIVDSRNTALALPTELLLNNLLRTYLGTHLGAHIGAHIGLGKPDMREEVMRWPMIENRFMSRTADDARNELQTWLAVENELRPINRLWLMGDNAARYLLSEDIDPAEVCWQTQSVGSSVAVPAIILPSLNELLQQPLLKARFWASVT